MTVDGEHEEPGLWMYLLQDDWHEVREGSNAPCKGL